MKTWCIIAFISFIFYIKKLTVENNIILAIILAILKVIAGILFIVSVVNIILLF
jgi:hypothetical protein